MSSSFDTQGFAANHLAFSPFSDRLVAIAAAANYGLVGNGRAFVVALPPRGMSGPAELVKSFETQDGVSDVAWSERNPNQLVSAGADGSVKLWDISLPDPRPIRNWHEHSREVMSIDWANKEKDLFVTSSWDRSIKLWTPDRQISLITIPEAHTHCIYSTIFAPHTPSLIASVSGSGHCKLYDTRLPTPSTPLGAGRPGGGVFSQSSTASTAPRRPELEFACTRGGGEALCIDWNKYRDNLVAIGGTSAPQVGLFDLRNVGQSAGPIAVSGGIGANKGEVGRIEGHRYAVRRVAWSPWNESVLASAGYDMTCRIWSTTSSPSARQLAQLPSHTEFAMGIAWSLFDEGLVGSVGWDGKVSFRKAPSR